MEQPESGGMGVGSFIKHKKKKILSVFEALGSDVNE